MDFSLRNIWTQASANKLRVSIIASTVFHVSGAIGMATPFRDWFLQFTPLVLILSTAFLVWNASELPKRLIVLFFAVFAMGFLAETIGVQTGLLFGNYHYGESFGPKVFGVPLAIGMNWAALCIASAWVISQVRIAKIWQILIGGFLPVFIDFFMEGLCADLDFWYWQDGIIPASNYLTWYAFSVLFVWMFLRGIRGTTHSFAPYFLGIQWAFFAVLNLIIT
ncbi:carotenoid biosynthesis protein [Pontibacter sp. G13]|uniref:carotenoid biosynthesis protein n=1 Tax=Pontibacter sp. G13 TaxID=3074898 RepID=UPI00288C5002|nr:carotenoid biosynthesis protein [Pontibacter sp. G13]WNJ18384.1 carotenoid biosynthesis protein [Pontibacter sp. G13]